MIFDFNRQTLIRRVERGSSGDSPGFKYTVPFQPKVVVQLPGSVLLHDEAQSRGGRYPMLTRRLGGLREVALCPIDGERRLRQLQVPCRSIMRRYASKCRNDALGSRARS